MHLHLHVCTFLWSRAVVKAKASTTASSALTSPIFSSLYVKADKKEQAACRSRLYPSTEWGGLSLVLQQRGPLRFPRSNEKLKKCVRFHVASSHGTGAMSSWYETKTRYERVRGAEARRARRSAACFGRRLTVGPARIEPTAHWRHTASRRQRRTATGIGVVRISRRAPAPSAAAARRAQTLPPRNRHVFSRRCWSTTFLPPPTTYPCPYASRAASLGSAAGRPATLLHLTLILSNKNTFSVHHYNKNMMSYVP